MPGEAPGAREERLNIVGAHPRRLPRDRRLRRGYVAGQRGKAVAAARRRDIEDEEKGRVTTRGTHATGRGNASKRKNQQWQRSSAIIPITIIIPPEPVVDFHVAICDRCDGAIWPTVARRWSSEGATAARGHIQTGECRRLGALFRKSSNSP